MMDFQEIIEKLEELSKPENVEGMARFGITPEKTYAVRIPELRKIAKNCGKNHELALKLWAFDCRETRILACMIEDPDVISSKQMDDWVLEFDYWEICDQCCMNLFRKTVYAYEKVVEWSKREEEFVKRAGFALIAVLAVHDKEVDDEQFENFLPLIINASTDNRNFVKKSVSWALRNIGKKNRNLNQKAINTALEIKNMHSKSSSWIAADVLRELNSKNVQNKLQNSIIK